MTHQPTKSTFITLQRTLIACALLFYGAFANAAGWISILKNTPAETFQDQDLRLFLDTAKQVLEADTEAQTVTWSNPDTGAGGSFLVLGQSIAKDGSLCKRVLFSVYATKSPARKAIWTACKSAKGQWQLTKAG